MLAHGKVQIGYGSTVRFITGLRRRRNPAPQRAVLSETLDIDGPLLTRLHSHRLA
ncbi:MAG TPA: hypothetical protein VFA81_04255 [Burkholderiales bacterium]|nr:hypothetical protein [Burkholderiales bacterium]